MTTTKLAPPEIPGYIFIEPIAGGGFADVFKYQQQRPSRTVAIKVLRDPASTADTRVQFEAEANVMGQLGELANGIVRIHLADEAADGRPYLVMEHCPSSLANRYRTEQIPLREVLEIGVQIASAVETAHRAGILHRDIKPANILISSRGEPKLTDFGIAGTTNQEDKSYGMSVPWAPPEALREKSPADVRSDVYSLAATVYSLLAGRSPFEIPGGSNDNATLMTRIERTPVARITRPDAPDSLNGALARAMTKRIEDRTDSALTFARELQAVQREIGAAETQLDVIDADAPAGSSVQEIDNHTRIKPVSIVVPEVIQEQRTRLKGPRYVSPVDDHTKSHSAVAPAEDTNHQPRGITTAAPPEQIAAAGTPWLLIGGGLAVVVLILIGLVVAIEGGEKSPQKVNPGGFENTETPDALAGYVASPTNTRADNTTTGEVVFTWSNPDPEPGDSYVVTWSIANEAQPVATVSDTTFTARGAARQIVCAQVALVRSDASSSVPDRQICEEVK